MHLCAKIAVLVTLTFPWGIYVVPVTWCVHDVLVFARLRRPRRQRRRRRRLVHDAVVMRTLTVCACVCACGACAPGDGVEV
jgi:hypothetical protein